MVAHYGQTVYCHKQILNLDYLMLSACSWAWSKMSESLTGMKIH